MSSRKRKNAVENKVRRKAMDDNEDVSSDSDESFCTDSCCSDSSEQPGPSSKVSSQVHESSDDSVQFISKDETESEKKVEETESEKKVEETESEEKKIGGIMLFSGGTNWDLVGRSNLPKHAKGAAKTNRNLWGPHKLTALRGVRVTFVASGCSACHSVIITGEGKAMTWGRNDNGQLGHNDVKRRDVPCLVETLKEHHIVSAACGRGHTIFLTDQDVVYSCGDNKKGQCGIGSQTPVISRPTKVIFKSRPISKVACGGEFSVILDSQGTLYTFGSQQYGQLGHNADGAYFNDNRIVYDCETAPRPVMNFLSKDKKGHFTFIDVVRIVDVACGLNHCVAADTKKRCFSWGFGAYGRLGHELPKDELVPRLIERFDGHNRNVVRVYAGSSYTLAINEHGLLYFWGATNKASVATMYPKVVRDMEGWTVKDVACGHTSIVVSSDNGLVSWGPSVTYGELCYGGNSLRSSTTPREVKTVQGIHIMQIACGYAHTLIIARDETREEMAKLDWMPEFDPSVDL